MATEEATIRYTVSGRVQGVGFRMFVQMHGLSIGLQGWVRNLPNGDVEAVARGSRERLSQFKALLWRGPEGASVSDVLYEQLEQPRDLPDTFEVRK